MISVADTWASEDALDYLEQGIGRATSSIKLGDLMPEPLVEYQDDPVGFMVDVLEIPEHQLRWSLLEEYQLHEWDGTPDPLIAILEGLRAWHDVGVESGTGTGKSFLLGAIYLWFLACWENSRVFTFAPKEDQLRLYSWMEIRKHFWPRFKRRFPLAELTDLRIRMIPGSDQWGAWGFPVQVRAGEEIAQSAKGQHAEHMLLVYEETPGIDAAVIEAGAHTVTAPHNLRLFVGNPDNQHDTLHAVCQEEGVDAVRVSGEDHPNVVCDDASIVPGACSTKSVTKIASRFGQASPEYKAQVRGLSPEESQDALIRAVDVRAAFERYLDTAQRETLRAQGYPARGCDVAQGGKSDRLDKAAIARGTGAVCDEVISFPIGREHDVEDAAVLGANLVTECVLEGINPMHVGIDPIGVGASTVNECRKYGFNVPSLNGSEKARPFVDEDIQRELGISVLEEELYGNLRAQMHWQLRMDLVHGRIAIKPDEELLRDLTSVEWKRRGGKIWVLDKEKIRQEVGRSPNKGDALVYWNFVRFRRAMPEPEPDLSAFDPDVLEHESREGRRVRDKPPVRPTTVPITTVEFVE